MIGKMSNYLFPALEIRRHACNPVEACLEWVFAALETITTTTGGNAITSRCTSSSLKRYEVFKDCKAMTAVSARPIEVAKGFQPFLCSESGRKSVIYSPVSRSGYALVLRFIRAVIAFATQFVVLGNEMRKERISTSSAKPSVFLHNPLSALGMIVTNQMLRDISKAKLNHAFHGSRVMAVFTLLFAPIPRYINEPFMYFHVPPKRKSPFASRCSATQRGRFDCISDLLATPSNSVNRDYTMRLERMCL
jgi:hypothetical protein